MTKTETELIESLRSMALEGKKPSEMLRVIHSNCDSEVLTRDVFAHYFREAFCFTEGGTGPIYGWLPDGSGEISDADIDYLMTKRIQKNKRTWQKEQRT